MQQSGRAALDEIVFLGVLVLEGTAMALSCLRALALERTV